MKKTIRIGTRKSLLALVQTEIVKDALLRAFPETEIEIVKIDTKGDQLLNQGDVVTARGFGKFELSQVGGQSRKGRTAIVVKRYL